MKQINKNFLYNIIYQIFIYIIPLISVPYTSRVLGVNNIGIYSYTYSIVYYFMLAAMLGINNYGSRLIAKCKNNYYQRSYQFSSLYSLQFILCTIVLCIYIIFVATYKTQYKVMLIIQAIYLCSVYFDINWFFFGMEKFKLTISRNIIIKLLSLVLIFVFVRENADLWKYTIIMSSSTLISQIYLWLHLRRYASFVKFKVNDLIIHLKKCIILFFPVIAYSIYRVMDKTMIGAIVSATELGYYENAEKITNIPISIITALGTVMLPYMSKNSEGNDFNSQIFNSFKLCFCCVIPMVFGLFAVGKNFAIVFFGNEFEKSGQIIRLLSISILFTAIANVIRTNYLIPKEQDKIYVFSTILGAIFNLGFNVILIPKFGAYGACIGTIVAEFTVMMYQIISIRHKIDIKGIFKLFAKYLIKGLIMFVIIFNVQFFISSKTVLLVIQICLGIVIYYILNYKYILYEFLGIKNNM